jgi:hypothetical protein
MLKTPFRALFLLRDSLNHIEVVPLTGVQAPGDSPLGGFVSGSDELLDFVRKTGLDSIVESYQVSDLPNTSFLYTFHLASSPESILELLTTRLKPEIRTAYRVLELPDERAPEQLTLSPHEAFQLGATTLSASEGLDRVRSWFRARRPVRT